MFIHISKVNGRYSFVAGDSPADDIGAMFCSARDFHLVDWVKSNYKSFGDAHLQAQRLVETRPSAILAKKVSYYKMAEEGDMLSMPPEDMMVAHYNEQLDLIQNRLQSIGDEKARDKGDIINGVSKEIEGIFGEIQNLKKIVESQDNLDTLEDIESEIKGIKLRLDEERKSLPAPKTAESTMGGIIVGFVKEMSERAMRAVGAVHPNAYLSEVMDLADSYESTISQFEEGEVKDILKLRFAKEALLTDILPMAGTWDESPLHSVSFLRKYWEPVVHAVGHIYIPEAETVMVSSIIKSHCQFGGFHVPSKSLADIAMSVDGDSWKVNVSMSKHAASKFKEDELREGMEVVCIKRELGDNYYNQTGSIKSIIPHRDYVDVVVDFRRGVGEIVLTDRDIDIVNLQS